MVFLFPIVFTLLRAVRPVFVYICILAVSGYSATFSHQVFQVEKEFREMTAQCVGEYVAGTDQPESCKILKDPHLPSVLDETEGVDLPFIRKSV